MMDQIKPIKQQTKQTYKKVKDICYLRNLHEKIILRLRFKSKHTK